MSNAMGQISRLFLRHRSKGPNSNREGRTSVLDGSGSSKPSEGAVSVPLSTACDADDVPTTTTHGEPPVGLPDEDLTGDRAPPVAQQLEEEIAHQRKLLQREFDMERMHRELLHVEVEKLHMARENQLMNRQFVAVLKERRELDRERKEMIAAAVEVWRELSGNENFTSKRAQDVSEAIAKALHQPASVAKIKEAEPRLLKRLRMCTNASEVRGFQADLKKKQEALFQLLLKSEAVVATGSYHRRPGGKDRASKPKTAPPVPPKTAAKRSRLGEPKVGSPRPLANPPPPPPPSALEAAADGAEAVTRNLQPISEEGARAPPANERRADTAASNEEPGSSRGTRNVLTWNLDVQGIRETAI